jgi:three-Cys-motif partner protein
MPPATGDASRLQLRLGTGSPVLALRTALNHSQTFPAPINFLFIEKDPERFKHLCGVLERLREDISKSPKIKLLPPLQDDCSAKLEALLDSYKSQGMHLGPALVFLDQFGYSAVSMELVSKIMKYPSCEVFSYLEWNRMNNYLADETKWPGITRAFGGEEWKAALDLTGRARGEFLLKLYGDQLRARGHAKYVWSFAMLGEGDKLLYWLFFCTGSLRGLEEMKRAMWKVDDSGGFRFSDAANPDQLGLFKGADDKWLAERLHKHFNGQTLKVSEVELHVLIETPCYKYKKALGLLESSGRLAATQAGSSRKRGSFDDPGMFVCFRVPPDEPIPPKKRQGNLF